MNRLSIIILFLISITFYQSAITPPSTPEILGVADDGSVTVTWNRVAEFSIDSLTGYTDFEGYRLYRSTDGGLTWGDIETDIIPQDGQIAGWRPIQQFDLSEDEDIERCVYLNGYDNACVDINPEEECSQYNFDCTELNCSSFTSDSECMENSQCIWDDDECYVYNCGEFDTNSVCAENSDKCIWEDDQCSVKNTECTENNDKCIWEDDQCSNLDYDVVDPLLEADCISSDYCDLVDNNMSGNKCFNICSQYNESDCSKSLVCILEDVNNDGGLECVDIDESLMRSISVSGADPIAPWFYLGDNTSLNHSFTDTDVINGIEYTYAITAYDMGVKIDTVVINNIDGQITLDTTWNISNPGQFSCPDGWGLEDLYNQCPSFESPKLSESFTDYNSNGTWDNGEPWSDENEDGIWNSVRENLINIVTVTPSKNASDISFPDVSNTEDFILSNSNNAGTGKTTYRLVDEQSLEPAMIKIEIQADNNYDIDDGLSDNDGDFENFSSRNPGIYVYRINEDETLYEGHYAEYPNNNDNAYLLELPGTTLNDNSSSILVPTYLIENHPVLSSNITSSENNFTDWFYGVQFRFDNYWSELPQTNSYATLDSIEFYNSEDEYNEFLEGTFSPIEIGGGGWNFQIPSGDITLEFWNEGFSNRAMFDYKIEFHTTEYIDTAFRNYPGSSEDFCLDVSLGNPEWDGRKDLVSFLPFKITNQTTGRQVRVFHTDEGIFDINNFPGIDGNQSDVPGYTDCIWQPNEVLSFAYDSLATEKDLIDCNDDCHDDWLDDGNEICNDQFNLSEEDCIEYCIQECSVDAHKTYQLKLEYDLSAVREKYEQGLVLDEEGYPYFEYFDFWEVGQNYELGDRVEVLSTYGIVGIYEAKRSIIDTLETYPNFCAGTCPPNTVYDNNGDNLNDNPWKQLYPWDDGDYVVVTPDKWFNDGDSWKVDLSRLGQKENLTSSMLDSVLVIPNPYVVGSQYNEEVYGNRLLFDKLPKECTISIYTVKGELVDKLHHGGANNLDGSMPWDLKNQNGDLVHPGLYFYTVEALGVKNKIGKFVIIR